ncbi:MAG: class I SAM-dependent methyltransferase [Chitinispirillaceae bacterium]|nr:class I SAM-dependent methyltransferase [Chitinispirillaceae bacterium]
MHLPTLLKKLYFAASGRLLLSDRVRNHAYQWTWQYLQDLASHCTILDIGSRDSLFPAFLAWKGYTVKVIERDVRFTGKQVLNGQRWGVEMAVEPCDFLTASLPVSFDAICSLFSLQHAGDNDIAAYHRAASLLNSGGLFLSATEYSHTGERFHTGRDDGTMRIYGPSEVKYRIEKPLSAEDMVECGRQLCNANDQGKITVVNDSPEKASLLLLLFRKIPR